MVCRILCNSDYVFVTFSFYVLFLFVISNNGGVSPPSVLLVYPLDLSLDGVLIMLELLLCEVNNGTSATVSCPPIDCEIS